MSKTVVTPSPGFISIAVSDIDLSTAFYETYLGGIRDTFDFGANAVERLRESIQQRGDIFSFIFGR